MANPIYTTVSNFIKYLGLYKTVPNKDSNTQENVGTGDNSTSTFWLDNLAIITGSYTLKYGASWSVATALTEYTDYTLDLDTSKITLTSGGITTIGANVLWADYAYANEELTNSIIEEALNAAESRVELFTGQRFADSSASSPNYREISNELKKGHYAPEDKIYDLFFSPIVEINTTTNGDYTIGSATITLSDASYLPSTGTLYIGGNKVEYTAVSGNDLTISTATPSISTGSVVRGEVIELSTEPEGSALSFAVLDPDTEYEVDYLNGRINILRNAYWGEINAEDRLYPSNYWVRCTYMQAWHEKNTLPTIPDEIQEVVHMIAAQRVIQRIINRAYMTGLNEFDPTKIETNEETIKNILEYYKPLNIGTSPYNKQFIS